MTDRLDKDIHGVEAWAKISKERELAANAATLGAARVMLSALKLVHNNWLRGRASIMPSTGFAVDNAIAQAERVGITSKED